MREELRNIMKIEEYCEFLAIIFLMKNMNRMIVAKVFDSNKYQREFGSK